MTKKRTPKLAKIHPTSNWQSKVIGWSADSQCTDVLHDRMLLRYAFQISPKLDMRRIIRAFEKLTQRHDTLRIQFVDVKGKWAVRINDEHPTGVQVKDFGEVDDEVLEAKANQYAAAPMSIFADSLIELLVLKFGRRGDVLIIRIHHAITDAYGLTVIIEEFLKSLLGIPFLSSAVSHADYLEQWERADTQADKELSGYWAERILPVIPPLNLGRKAKGLEEPGPNARQSTIGLQLPVDKVTYSKIGAAAKKSGVSFFSYVVAAFAEVICDFAGVDEVYIQTPVGRHSRKLDTYVGEHTKHIWVRYKKAQDWNAERQAALVASQLREGMSHLPSATMELNEETQQAISDCGAQLGIYLAREAGSYARMKSSRFGNAFLEGPNKEQRMGLWKIREMQLRPQAHTISELQIDLIEDLKGHTVCLGADADAYDSEELAKIGDAIVKKLTG